ncbi:MAG: tetratricopeptide repeat protein [Bacteroidota bacterium]|nr:tetratricopeptide repeat protein [Bacteroidota bacterium]MDP4289341.1 tetratricopeptide repeat protein [Bacteroidota bacterium]
MTNEDGFLRDPIRHLSFVTRHLSLLLLVATIGGCTFWHNFSTYFNTLYLAQTHLAAYEEQQRTIVAPNPNGAIAVQNHRWLDEEYDLRQRALYEGRTQAVAPSFSRVLGSTKEVTNMHLDSAIILGSKILADKKPNKYIEDALFVVGKAQYYKNDFAGARRKFLELLYKYPDTKYGAEVQVLLARSMLADRRLDTAEMALTVGLQRANESGDKNALAEVHRTYAEYIYAKNPDSLTAVGEELRKAEEDLSGQDLAKLAFEEGALDYMNGQWPEAERAFTTAINSTKDDWLAGEAHIDHAMALRREAKFDEARTELRAVIDKLKYSASAAAARYELTLTDEYAARHAVSNDLRTPQFKSGFHPPLHLEYFAIDTAFRNSSAMMIAHSHFREAEMYREMGLYDSAAKAAAMLINTKDFATPAMNDYVSTRASSLASFAKWRTELGRVDSQIARFNTKGPARAEVDLKIKALKEVLGSRFQPTAPAVMSKEDSAKFEKVYTQLQKQQPGGAAFVVSDTARSLDSLGLLAATAHYQLGRSYETFLEIPQARAEYNAALAVAFAKSDTAASAMRAQAMYAQMQLEYHDKQIAAGDSLLDELLAHYGQTVYAEQARMLFPNKIKRTPGQTAYETAYATLREHGLDAAKASLLAVVAGFPEEDAAPRSLYAIGLSYEDSARYDSAVVYYKRVMHDYPYSVYALALHPRFADATNAAPHGQPPPVDPTQIQPGQHQQRAPRMLNQPGQQPTQRGLPPRSRPQTSPRGRFGMPGNQHGAPPHFPLDSTQTVPLK